MSDPSAAPRATPGPGPRPGPGPAAASPAASPAGPALDAVTVAHLAGRVEWTDSAAAAQARQQAARDLGTLTQAAEWLAETQGAWPPRPPAHPHLLVTATPPDRLRALAGADGVRVDELTAPRWNDASAAPAVDAGAQAAGAALDDGADLLLVATGADDDAQVAAAVLVGLYTGAEPVALLPRGADAVDTVAWVARAERLRDLRRTAADLRDEPDELLAVAGSPAVAALVGAILCAAARRVGVVVDGAGAVAAALLCHDVAPRATRWCRPADTGTDPVLVRGTQELGVPALLAHGTSAGDGTAAVLCVALARSVAALHGTPA